MKMSSFPFGLRSKLKTEKFLHLTRLSRLDDEQRDRDTASFSAECPARARHCELKMISSGHEELCEQYSGVSPARQRKSHPTDTSV